MKRKSTGRFRRKDTMLHKKDPWVQRWKRVHGTVNRTILPKKLTGRKRLSPSRGSEMIQTLSANPIRGPLPLRMMSQFMAT